MRRYATGLLARDQCRTRHRCGVTRRDSECPIPLLPSVTPQPQDGPGTDSTPDADSGSHPTIRQGSQGAPVAHAQCLLRNVWGYGGVDVDGIFGPRTRSAVIDMRRRCGIAQDGIVGPNTWNCLHP